VFSSWFPDFPVFLLSKMDFRSWRFSVKSIYRLAGVGDALIFSKMHFSSLPSLPPPEMKRIRRRALAVLNRGGMTAGDSSIRLPVADVVRGKKMARGEI
jgi:hypothetical protein